MVDAGYMTGFVGVLGAVLLLIAWIPQTLRTIRTRRTGMEPKFLYIYFFGNLLLTAYAFLVSDRVFFVLNAALVLVAGINVYYYRRHETGHVRKADGGRRRP